MFGTVVVSALRVWPVDTSAGCSIRGSSPWETQRSNKSPHNHPLGLTLFIPLLVCLPYCELKLVWSATREAWEIFHSRSQTVTFHFMDPRPLLRDYFDVPYLSLSASNSKCHQTAALGNAEGNLGGTVSTWSLCGRRAIHTLFPTNWNLVLVLMPFQSQMQTS